MQHAWLFWMWGIAAALFAGLSKTGLPGIGILAVASLMEILPTRAAVGAVLPLLIAGDIMALLYYRKNADWPRLLALFPSVLLGIAGAYFFLRYMNDARLKPFLGVLIFLLALLELLRQWRRWRDFPHRPWFTVCMGSLAGFATTVGNVAGPIMNIYLISMGFDKTRFMGTIAWYFFIFNCLKVPLYCRLGMLNTETLLLDLKLMPAVVAGAFLGRMLLYKMPAPVFRLAILFLAMAAAWRLILS